LFLSVTVSSAWREIQPSVAQKATPFRSRMNAPRIETRK
jgi:hypothetical protein